MSRHESFMQILRAELADRTHSLHALAHWPSLSQEILHFRNRSRLDPYPRPPAQTPAYTPNIARFPPPGPMQAPLE